MSVVDDAPARRRGLVRPGAAPGPDDAAAPTAARPPAGISASAAERGTWSLVWLGIVGSGVSVWGSWTDTAAAAVLAPLLVLVGTTGLLATWTAATMRKVRPAAMVGALAAVAASQAPAIHGRRFYTTDSAALIHQATRVLLDGHNPYTASMAGVARLLQHPAQYWTYTVDGGHVTRLSYPAGSVLLNAPFMGLGLSHQVVDWTDLAAWIVTGILLLRLLPESLRWLASLVTLTPLFVGVVSSGGTDAAAMPLLVVAVWRWDAYGRRSAGVARWIGPVALGLACAVKQGPWFCVPFLVFGVAMAQRRSGGPAFWTAVRYSAVVALAFVVVNLPFIVWSPGAWAKGTLIPFAQPLVADGQGLVTLALHGLTGGVGLRWLMVAASLAYVALLAAFVATYPLLQRAWLLVLPLVFFFSDRSLTSYLVDYFPAALVAALTVGAVAGVGAGKSTRARMARRRALTAAVVGVPAAGVVAASVLAFGPAPLALTVRGTTVDLTQGTVTSVTLEVENHTSAALSPHFLVDMGNNHPAGFWMAPSGGNLHLGPGASATVTLLPPGKVYAPHNGSRWLVEAYTPSPRWLSTSALGVWGF